MVMTAAAAARGEAAPAAAKPAATAASPPAPAATAPAPAAPAAKPAATTPKPEAKPPAPASQPAAPAVAPQPASAAEKLVATVKSVEGTVEVRPAVGQPWTAIKVGQELPEGADLRTGFRARCVLDCKHSTVQVDPLTVIRIGELRREGGKVVTRIYMKQGNTQANVAKEAVKNDFAIVTPSATLSVRGTNGIRCCFFPDRGGTYGLSVSGSLGVIGSLGQRTGLVPGQQTNDNAQPPADVQADGHVPPILDQFAYSRDERWAAMRWNTSMPTPTGLGGEAGSPSTQAVSGPQQSVTPYNPAHQDYTVIIGD
jgi:hypothetical protein